MPTEHDPWAPHDSGAVATREEPAPRHLDHVHTNLRSADAPIDGVLSLNVENVVAYAELYPRRAEKLLDAELNGQQRKTLIPELERLAAEAEAEK